MPATLPSPRISGVLPLVPFPLALARSHTARNLTAETGSPISEHELTREEPTKEVVLVRLLLLRSNPIIRA
jgi:hypothetical protein